MTITEALTPSQAVWQRIGPDLVKAGVECYLDFPPFAVEKSGSVYAVVQTGAPGLLRSKYHALAARPRCMVNVYADHERDETGGISAHTAESRALGVVEHFLPRLASVTARDWPEIISCQIAGDIRSFPIIDGDGALMMSTAFDLEMYGSTNYVHE